MKITNKHELPYPLYEALKGDGKGDENTFKIHPGHISLSKLLMPVQQAILMHRHDAELEEDAADRVWMIIGSAFHYVLEQGYVPNALREAQMKLDVLGWSIHMRLDCWYDGTLADYKVGSVWSHILGDPSDYEEQLNAYGLAVREHFGLDVERLQAVRIFRDWSQRKYDDDVRYAGQKNMTVTYPPIPFAVVDVDLWPLPKTRSFLETRIKMFESNWELPDEELTECTAKERWQDADTWAVYKPGGKRAVRVLGSENEAVDWIAGRGDYEIQFRPGQSRRCENYCSVRDICAQYARLRG